MQLTLDQLLRNFDRDLTAEIIKHPEFQKSKAFGKAERFLLSPQSTEIKANTLTKFGLYAYEMDKGRGKTKNKTGGLYEAIYEWLSLKKYNMNWDTDEDRVRLAKGLTMKITLYGTYKYIKKDKNTTIYADSLKKALPVLERKVADLEINKILYAI